jgi:hypothetical protein
VKEHLFSTFVPKYYGIKKIDGVDFIGIEDKTARLHFPSVIGISFGERFQLSLFPYFLSFLIPY